MKTKFALISLFLATVLLTGCGNFKIGGKPVRTIQASNTFVSEERSVSGYHAIEIGTVGNVLLSQGAEESVTVQGPDNVVMLIKTRVDNGTLVIYTDEPITIVGMQGKNNLTFIIKAKDVDGIKVSGVAAVNVDNLSSPTLAMEMSGAGEVKMNGLTTENLKITVSGLGNIRVAGTATSATIVISGAGPIDAKDLQVQTANVDISGLGGATLWVTDRLTGTISGGGSVSYYGSPQTTTKTSGIGVFKSLGNK